MVRYVFGRLLATIPVVLVVAVFVFSLLYITPGDPALIIAGDQASPDEVERIRVSLGLDRPAVIRFADWFWHVLQGDLGQSVMSGQPVTQLIGQRIDATLSLMLLTIVLSVTIAIPLGVVAAVHNGKFVERIIMIVSVAGFSIPVFVTGYMLAWVFAVWLGWLPPQGYTPLSEGLWPWLRTLILPSVALSFVYVALIARITRATMLEVLTRDYIRTARAKGLRNWPILFVHALKNAAVPIITVIGTGVALLIGGAVVVESVFAIPGLGRLTIDAIMSRDYPVIQGVVLLFSFSYVIVNLLVDILYTVFDPRIRY